MMADGSFIWQQTNPITDAVTFTFVGTLLLTPDFPTANSQVCVVSGSPGTPDVGDGVVLRGLYATPGAGEFLVVAFSASPSLGGPGDYTFQK
jgi:hypothetical protein